MIHLKILNGKKAGADWTARRFPFRIGRDPGSDLCLDDDGIWERHSEISLERRGRFCISALAEAATSINGQTVQQAILRNGDLMELGSLQIRFELSPPRQRGMRLREALTWIGLAALCLGQVALINWLSG